MRAVADRKSLDDVRQASDVCEQRDSVPMISLANRQAGYPRARGFESLPLRQTAGQTWPPQPEKGCGGHEGWDWRSDYGLGTTKFTTLSWLATIETLCCGTLGYLGSRR